MTHKISIYFLILFSSFFCNAQEIVKSFVVNGTVEGSYSGYVYLKTLGSENIKDSAKVVDNKFRFQGIVLKTTKAQLMLNKPSTVVSFFMENSNIDLTITVTTFKNGAEQINDLTIKKVKGSRTQDIMTDIENSQEEIEKMQIGKEDKNKKIFKKYYEVVISNPELAILDYLIQKSTKKGTLTLEQIQDLKTIVAKNEKKEQEKDSLIIRNTPPISKKLIKGKKVENFTLKNVQGKNTSLSDFKGRFVLLDFWASWYKPSRNNNKNMVKVYQAYKNKDLEIVSVSLDTNQKLWLDAIEKDGLTWNHLIDTDGWHGKVVTQFEVKGIPFNILLDKQGKIIAINTRGDELLDRLEYLLNQENQK